MGTVSQLGLLNRCTLVQGLIFFELMIRSSEVFNVQRCCRSAFEDPDRGLYPNP